MKKLILIAISCGLLQLATAQDSRRAWIVGLRVGPSIPVGKMANGPSVGSPHDNAGNALPGFTGDVLASYRLHKSWGVSVSLGGTINHQNNRELARQLNTFLPPEAVVLAKANNWKSFRVMSGGHYAISLTANGSLELQPGISLGVCKTAFPGNKVSYRYETDTPFQHNVMGGYSSRNQPVPWLFCYQADLSFNIHVSRRVFIMLDLAYFNASFTQKYAYGPDQTYPTDPFTVYVGSSLPTLVVAEKKYALSSVNALGGVAIKL